MRMMVKDNFVIYPVALGNFHRLVLIEYSVDDQCLDRDRFALVLVVVCMSTYPTRGRRVSVFKYIL